MIKLRWHITSQQTTKDGPYETTRTLQVWNQVDGEWEDVEELHDTEYRYDGLPRDQEEWGHEN